MGYLSPSVVREWADLFVRARLSPDEILAGIRAVAPAIATIHANNDADQIFQIFATLNDHPDPELLRDWLLDARLFLKQRAWPEAELHALDGLIKGLEQASRGRTLAESEQRYQDRLIATLQQLQAEQRRLKASRPRPDDQDALSTLATQIQRVREKQLKGRPLAHGDILDGRFELQEEIGHGGFSTVWVAFDLKTPDSDTVAVKVLRGELRGDKSARERFFTGAAMMQRAARVATGFVSVIVERAQDGPYHYYVMEYLSGGTLEQRVLADPVGARRNAEKALLATCKVVESLHARGELHLDIKPSNILFDEAGNPRVTDFEQFHRLNEPLTTHQGRPHVSLYYSAPEVARGIGALRESDIFSLGRVALFIEVGGLLDQEVENPTFLDKAVPTALVSVIRRATHADPQSRFSDVAALRAALDEGLLDPGDLDRWLMNVALPDIIHRTGPLAQKTVHDLLATLQDTRQLSQLIDLLNYEPGWINNDVALWDAAFSVCDELIQRNEVLPFWHLLENLQIRTLSKRIRVEHRAPPPEEKLHAILLTNVPLDQLQFLSMVVLSERASATLPDPLSESLDPFIGYTLEVLLREKALSRFISLLAEARPSLKGRLRGVVEELLPGQGVSYGLWRVWDAIPMTDPGGYLRGRLPPSADGFIAPTWAWDAARMRHEGAILLWQHHLTDAPRRLDPPPETAREALILLLAAMYGTAELRLLATRLGPDIAMQLPGPRASRWIVASMLVDAPPPGVLLSVFALLLQQRPHCSSRIYETAQRFGFTSEKCDKAAAPAPSLEWRLGELIFRATAGVEVRWKSLDIPPQVTLGPSVAPRLRAQHAAEWLLRQGRAGKSFFDQLSKIAPHLDQQIAELQATFEATRRGATRSPTSHIHRPLL